MPEEEEDDDKKGAKGGKKADKGKKDKKGGKGKGGKDKGGKDKGGKGKGGKDDKGKAGKGKGAGKGGSKSGSKGGSKGGSKSGSKPSSSEGSVDKHKDKKDAGHKPSKESIKSPSTGSATEHKHGHEKEKHEEGAKDHKHEEKPGEGTPHGPGHHKPEEAKEGGEHKDGKHDAHHKEGAVLSPSDSKEKHGKHDAHHKEGGILSPSDSKEKHGKHDAHHKEGGVLSPSDSKEKHGKHDAHHKEGGILSPSHSKEKHGKHHGSDKSSASEKSSIKSSSSAEKTSKSESSEKSSEHSGSKSEGAHGHGHGHGHGHENGHKKPSILSHHKGGEHARTGVPTLTAHGPMYAEHYYDDESDDEGRNYIEIQMFGRRHSGGPADQASQGAWNQYYYDGAQLQAGGQWSSNQQFVSGPEPGGFSENYGDLTLSVWQGPPQQQGVSMDAGRNMMIAQKLKEMQHGLAQPLPDDMVTTERVIYEVTRGRPGSQALDSSGAPPFRASSGPLVVRSSQGASQFYGPPGFTQAVVRHEMRQSSGTRLHNAGPGGLQVRASSNHGMISSVAPPGPSSMRPPSAHSFRGHGGAHSPVSPRASKSGGGVHPQQAADIIKQQADIIDRQSNIINQQSSIIDQQLGLVDAALRGGTSAGCVQVVPQEFAVPALPAAQMDGAYDNEMFVSAEIVETNRMPRNPWNRRH